MRAVGWLASIAMMAIAILGGPPAIISLIGALTNWRSALEGPVAQWNSGVEEIGQKLPVVSDLPVWTLNVIYLSILLASMVWLYFSSVASEAKRLEKLANTGALDPVEPLPINRPIRETVVWGTGLLGLFGGTFAIVFGAVTLNPVVIAGGFAAVYSGSGVIAVGVATDAMEGVERHAHAEAQSLRQAESRRALVKENVEAFRRSEVRKLGIGGAIAFTLALANFAVPALYSLFDYLDFG